jgi:adenine deaminase
MTVANPLELFISQIPKAELHVHLEGTLEPEMLLSLAHRNNISLPYKTINEVEQAYSFKNLQDFLDIYYRGAAVLLKEQDFYDLTYAYLYKLHKQNVKYADLMFDPQTHTHRGIALKTVIDGISKAQHNAFIDFGIKSNLILSFLRHLSEDDAIKTFKEALYFRKHFIAVGLDSSERGYPPHKFQRVFEMTRKEGLISVAHAGEEGPASNIREALELLNAQRIDHGISAISDPDLMQILRDKQIPLTLCPLSNKALKVIPKLEDHPLKEFMDRGLLVTVNSDDPAYFGGTLTDNYLQIAKSLNLSLKEITQLAINSFKASFLPEAEKESHISHIEKLVKNEFVNLL